MRNKLFTDKLVILLLVTAWMSIGCKKLIEIPPNPPTKITQTLQFGDSATTMTAVAGVYSYPSTPTGGFTFNDGYLSVCAGLSSDELTSTVTYTPDPMQLYGYNISPFNGYVASLWQDPYQGIYPVNAVIQGVAGNSNLSTSFITQITAEMKVVRALYYFYMVNMFGGVPLVTSTDYKSSVQLGRASEDSIYALVLSDLTDAQLALSVNYPSSGHIRPNLYTVKAFLSKVYLYQKNWQMAFNAADTVINSGLYSLEPDLNSVFLDGSQEAIWQLPATSPYMATKEAQNFVPYNSSVIPTYPVTPLLTGAFEAGDQRLGDWIAMSVVNTGASNDTVYYPFKYKVTYPSGGPIEDFMIFRLGELYLIHAEAAAQLGNLPTALSDLNLVRARAGLGASAATTQQQVLAAIMHERQTELFCEWGNRWMDLKRTGTAGSVLSAEKTGWNPTDTLYPVPNSQLQLNSHLIQNPGYN
jgi:starch-binding outer membrane protein, SusD/RagB family